MTVRWRWVLPIGHLAIDCVLLTALVSNSNRFRSACCDSAPAAQFRPVLLQESVPSIRFEPRNVGPPGPFLLISTGNPVAALVTSAVRPNAWIVGWGRAWDPVWFLLHAVIACVSWYALGFWIDSGRHWLSKIMLIFLATRIVCAATTLYEIGWRIQVLFWWALAMWHLGMLLIYLFRLALCSVPTGRRA
jgi:hypothetical protein